MMAEYDIAQLRHAYAHLVSGRNEAAKEVIASVIRSNERRTSGKENAMMPMIRTLDGGEIDIGTDSSDIIIDVIDGDGDNAVVLLTLEQCDQLIGALKSVMERVKQ